MPLGSTIRILSANLWTGAADPDAFVALAEELAADVVAVQELSHDQAEALAAAFPHGRLEPSEDVEGAGVALRRPGEVERLALRRRDGFRVALSPADWPELHAPLEVIGVHLIAPHARFGLGLLRRRPQFADLKRHLQAPAPGGRVVVGDFNSTPAWPLYWGMKARMQDAAVAVAERQGERPARTWGPWSGAPRLLRIDHGFVSGVEAEGFRVVAVPGSDHSAVLLEVGATS